MLQTTLKLYIDELKKQPALSTRIVSGWVSLKHVHTHRQQDVQTASVYFIMFESGYSSTVGKPKLQLQKYMS